MNAGTRSDRRKVLEAEKRDAWWKSWPPMVSHDLFGIGDAADLMAWGVARA